MNNNKMNPLKKINITYYLALLPLLIYGIYKNYYIPYSKKLINSSTIIKIILLTIVIVITSLIIEFILNKKTKNIKETLSLSMLPIFSLMLIILSPVKLNIVIYFIGIIVSLLAIRLIPENKITINKIAVASIVIFLILSLVGDPSYLNSYESTKNLSYNLFDSFFGRTIGPLGTTNIFLVIIGFIILTFNDYYKKEIPIVSTTAFILVGIILSIFSPNKLEVLELLIKSNFIFVTIFISTISSYSPMTTKGSIIYAIMNGILSIILIKYVNYYQGALISVIITSLLINIIDKKVLQSKRSK